MHIYDDCEMNQFKQHVFEEYGIDFKKHGIYVAEKDKDGYYVNETENGSGVWITDKDIHNDFDVEEE